MMITTPTIAGEEIIVPGEDGIAGVISTLGEDTDSAIAAHGDITTPGTITTTMVTTISIITFTTMITTMVVTTATTMVPMYIARHHGEEVTIIIL